MPMTRYLLAALCALLPLATPAQPAASGRELNRVVAVVNNDVILATELEQRIRTAQAQLKRRNAEVPAPEVLRRQALERLIVDRLQLQLAEKSGIRVTDEMLNEAMRRIADQNKVSLAEFRRVLEADGYDFEAFREEVRSELIISELRRRQVDNRVQVTDREVDNLLMSAARQAGADDEYRVSHIVIQVPDGASPEVIAQTRERAQQVLDELRGGADFARVAAVRSNDSRALEGGDLGWRRLSQLPTAIADEVLRLKAGELSGVIRGPDGFHLVKLVDVRRTKSVLVTQTHARHILLRPDPSRTDEAVRSRLAQLRLRIVGGDDFAELARANSADSGSAGRGGDLGWVKPGDMVPEFERTMNELQTGDVSQPFRTQFGWHIVQVLERREQDSTDDVRRARARDYLRQRKSEEDTEAWLRRLRDEAYVEYRLER